MVTPLLATKLYLPPARPGLVTRPRLMQRLQAGLNHSLVLVSAPAGFGKTTLLSEWIHHNQPPVPAAWLSLEEADNDPTRFWDYFIAAIRTLHPEAGNTALELLDSPQPVPIQNTLTELINDLMSTPNDFLLVLDDYHFINLRHIHDGIAFLLEHLPPKMHLVIATRVDPPLALTHYRGRGTMLEIGADDLRFNPEEAGSLLAELGIVELSYENIVALNARAEGWVVGLKMAMLSLRGEKDISGFIAGFTGSQRYIMDYLIEEVLQRQSAAVRDFLLQTSVLERLSGPLCDAVAGGSNGRETLHRLEKENLFIVPLDEKREWYRYEHLFAELLRHRLEIESSKEMVAELQKRASRWYEGNGYRENAINHALAAQDWERAMDLIVASRPSETYGGLIACNWLRQVPREILLTKPSASTNYIWALILIGQHSTATTLLDDLEKLLPVDTPLRGEIAAMRAMIASQKFDPAIEEYARKALLLLAPDNFIIRGVVSLSLGANYLRQMRLIEAEQRMAEAYELFQQAGTKVNVGRALIQLATIVMLRGKLHQAEEMFKQAKQMAGRNPNTVQTHTGLFIIYYLWNDLKAAESELAQGFALNPGPGAIGTLHLYTTYLRLAQGEVAAAASALEKAESVLINTDTFPTQRARIAGYHVAVAVAQEDPVAVSRWLEKLMEYKELRMRMSDVPTSAGFLLQNRLGGEAVEDYWKLLVETTRREGHQFYLIWARVGQALVVSNPQEALSSLADALTMAKPEGNIRMFADFGIRLAPLLRLAIARGIEPEYAGKLLTTIETEEKQRLARKGAVTTPVSVAGILSERELEVLKLMNAGLSNQQIAAKLVVSVGTAKTHVHHILEKLYAGDRLQAINRARELKLIP